MEEEVPAAVEVQTSSVENEIMVVEDATQTEEVKIEPGAVLALPLAVKPKHKVFLSHSGEQKAFVERLCVALKGCYLHPFFDQLDDSLPIGEIFPDRIFGAIEECLVGVVVLSDEFFSSKWPMMELVAMMKERRRRYFTIIPVFYSISFEKFDDPKNRDRWVSEWHKLAESNPKRVEVEEWEAALKNLRAINSLVYDGLSELRLENEIVNKICHLVPPEIRMDDMHIQGKEHLCKVIQDKIDALQEVQINGICTMGLYGVGGTGKTSICKVLCNEYFNKFRGRVCHAEIKIGKKSEEELMREVVKKLTGTNYEHLRELNVDQLCNLLKEGIIRDAVFLAVDDVSDTPGSIKQAKSYLSASLPTGSIVMVTARSKNVLKKLRPYIDDDSKCLEMPELKVEHAEMLFAKSSNFEPRNEDDQQLLRRCIQHCYFQKGAGDHCSHYHPLALDVLGRHLGNYDSKEWGPRLSGILDHRRQRSPTYSVGDEYDSEVYAQIFSTLRTSYNALSREDQLLFMDIALFLPERTSTRHHFEWLRMVHEFPCAGNMMTALETLKSKSLLESTGDEIETSIGMHDLWRAFCVAETKSAELGRRRWVYEAGKASELVENSPSGTCWGSVKRIAFLDCKLGCLKRVNFAHFPNVRVLKITHVCMTKKLVVDLSGLIHLKSLEVSGRHLQRLVLQGLPRGLVCLHLISEVDGLKESDSSRHPTTRVMGYIRDHWQRCWFGSPQLIEQIMCLKDLQFLFLVGYGGHKLPDIRSMVSLLVAKFESLENVITLTGLSPKMTNLRSLSLKGCKKLRSCPGLGDLVHLEFLDLQSCRKLRRLPNLRMCRNLKELDILGCPLIVEVPGLSDLVALRKFSGGDLLSPMDKCSYRLELPDLSKLSNLEVLNLRECRLKAIPGFDSLSSLQHLEADFRELDEIPSLAQLTKLQSLTICGWSSKALGELDNLVMLRTLQICQCRGIDKLPEFQSLRALQFLEIWDCEFKDVSGLRKLSALHSLLVYRCTELERLPDLRRGWDCTSGSFEVTKLRSLILWGCERLDNLMGIQSFSHLEILDCFALSARELPSLSSFPRLKTLRISFCFFRSLTCHEPMNALSKLEVIFGYSLVSFPDLSNFPGLSKLVMNYCHEITSLPSGSLTGFQEIDLRNNFRLTALPDLGMFPALEKLLLENCCHLKMLSSSVPLTALQVINLSGCWLLEGLPDLGMFPALQKLLLEACCNLKMLSSSVPLTALQVINLSGCLLLERLPDLGMFPALEEFSLIRCGMLRTLSSRVPLPALKELDARGCTSLSQDDLDQLQALCPQCTILEFTWISRLLGCETRDLVRWNTNSVADTSGAFRGRARTRASADASVAGAHLEGPGEDVLHWTTLKFPR